MSSASGARGGKDQFNWENVKSDKDREFYLGHSVKASVGRWQKGVCAVFVLNLGTWTFPASVCTLLAGSYGTADAGLKTSYSAGKDIFWYAKEKQDNGEAVQEELNMVKAREEELMLEVVPS
jgi:hypothetical protein